MCKQIFSLSSYSTVVLIPLSISSITTELTAALGPDPDLVQTLYENNIHVDAFPSSFRTPSRRPPDAKKIIKFSTVKKYAQAIVDLWQQQGAHGTSPRGYRVKKLLEWVQKEENRISKENYDDRGGYTAADGYSSEVEIKALMDYFWSNDDQLGLRDGLMILLQHFGLLRGESVRMLEFPDLQSMTLDNEGITPCHTLVMILKQGKTNQHGRVEAAGCFRHKEVKMCAHMMLACYFFSRYHVHNEEFPGVNLNSDWFDYKVIKNENDKTGKKELGYHAHRETVIKAFESIGLYSKAKTHAMRGSAARIAELGGSSEASIQRAGRWNNSALTVCYLTNIPREFMRTMAGFAVQGGHYYLPRAEKQPPESLVKDVFPFVDKWQARIRKGKIKENATSISSAVMFLKLLDQLRRIFLQDSVLLKQLYPQHHLWNHSLFEDQRYLDFER